MNAENQNVRTSSENQVHQRRTQREIARITSKIGVSRTTKRKRPRTQVYRNGEKRCITGSGETSVIETQKRRRETVERTRKQKEMAEQNAENVTERMRTERNEKDGLESAIHPEKQQAENSSKTVAGRIMNRW